MALLKCKRPLVMGKGQAFGCGQCLPCRINKRREWTHRIMLEAQEHAENTFLTLSYNDENLPEDGSVVPRHVTLFMKRLRQHYAHERIRYYAVGEYGDRSERPHYHIALFGFRTCYRGQTDKRRADCCPRCSVVTTTWGKGYAYLAGLHVESAAYIAGYTVKKWTAPDTEQLDGRHPEFARMSNRPGIGGDYAHEVASTLLEHNISHVPRALRHGSHIWPLGDYLCKRISKFAGGLPIAPAQSPLEVQELSQEIYSNPEVRPGFRRFALENALKARQWDRAEYKERVEREKRRQRETF
jgi:hypothetical protein